MHASLTRRTLLWSACALALCLTVMSPEAEAAKYGLPDGWTEVKPQEGRQVAVLHTDSLTRMEGWKVAISDVEIGRFHTQLERRLTGRGFRLEGQSKATVASYPATVYRWKQTVLERTFTLHIVEVYRRGELWQFSSVYLAGPLESTWEEALMTFSKSLLSS